ELELDLIAGLNNRTYRNAVCILIQAVNGGGELAFFAADLQHQTQLGPIGIQSAVPLAFKAGRSLCRPGVGRLHYHQRLGLCFSQSNPRPQTGNDDNGNFSYHDTLAYCFLATVSNLTSSK